AVSVLGATTSELYLLAALRGAVLVLDAPSRQALTYQMVGRESLPNAVALNSSLFNGARVVGPALGGLLVAFVRVQGCFVLHQGPSTFGVISACFGAGALVGALLSAGLGRASWRVFLVASAGLGGSELVLAPQRSLAGAGLALFAMGVFFTLWTSTANSTLQ